MLLPLAEGFSVTTGVVAVLGGEAAANLVDFGDGKWHWEMVGNGVASRISLISADE